MCAAQLNPCRVAAAQPSSSHRIVNPRHAKKCIALSTHPQLSVFLCRHDLYSITSLINLNFCTTSQHGWGAAVLLIGI